AGCWNRTNTSRLSIADSHPSTRKPRVPGTPGLDLRANPAWCAVRELNPHLLGVGQLFWSVELPAQTWWRVQESNLSSHANLAPERKPAYKALPLPEDPLKVGGSRWIRTIHGRLYESRVLPTE